MCYGVTSLVKVRLDLGSFAALELAELIHSMGTAIVEISGIGVPSWAIS